MHSRLFRVAVVIVGLSAAAAGCGKYSISNIRSLKAFQDANKHYLRGEYKQAIERYEDSVRFNPELGFAYFFLGNSYDQMYKPSRKGEAENDAYLPKAVEYYRIAIDKMKSATDPKELEIRKRAYEYLVDAYSPQKMNDFSKAEPVMQELIALEPNDPANHQALGRLYEDQGMYEEAEAEFKKAIDVNPSDALGYQYLASYYNRQGEFDKTMEAFQQRANVEPNNPEAWHTMSTFYSDKVIRDKGLARAKQLEYVEAGLAAEDKALAINAEYHDALVYKNILLRQKALLVRSPAEQKALIEEADALQARAEEIRKKQNEAGGGGDAKAGGSGGGN
ncbi:MAG: tetratricopeptide repeat protein [Vicinamibacterales bacterium]